MARGRRRTSRFRPSFLRTQEPIRRGPADERQWLTHCPAHGALWIWAPAFAGATRIEFHIQLSNNPPPSSSGSTGRSSTPQLIDSITDVSGILDHPPSASLATRTSVMTTEHNFAISRHHLPEACHQLPALQIEEGAGKTGCALHPRSRVQLRTKNAHTSIQVQRKHPGLPCAVALRLTSSSPR